MSLMCRCALLLDTRAATKQNAELRLVESNVIFRGRRYTAYNLYTRTRMPQLQLDDDLTAKACRAIISAEWKDTKATETTPEYAVRLISQRCRTTAYSERLQ